MFLLRRNIDDTEDEFRVSALVESRYIVGGASSDSHGLRGVGIPATEAASFRVVTTR